MQSQDIEILNTLAELDNISSMIQYHTSQANPSYSSIENYQVLRLDLLDQLNELLKSYSLTIRLLEEEQIAA